MKSGWAEPRPEATKWYWDSAHDAHRDRLVAALSTFHPFTSIFEPGCHVGPVRRRLREAFGSEFFYFGVDINNLAITDARKLSQDDRRAIFEVSDVSQLEYPAGSFDIVVTSGMLMCLEPQVAERTLELLRRLAQRAVICQEPVGTGNYVDGHGWSHSYPSWVTLVQ